MRLAFLGPPGTFGEEAAIRYASDAERVACPSHAAVATAVEAGNADEGIVAIENSLNGSVSETLDILVHETRLQIQAELVLPIEHYLLAKPGTRASDITVIYSHPQPLGQCRKYLEANFPNAQLEASLSTAGAVETAVAKGDGAAAIGTGRAGEIYGAQVLAKGIQDQDNNVTRFVVLGRNGPPPTGHDRTSIAFTFARDLPGSLAGVVDIFAEAGINLFKIESRPTREVFGEYVFLIDFAGHKDDAVGREVLGKVRALCAELKVFGSYPCWQ